MKLTVREKNLIIITVTFTICALILTYLVLPLKDQYSEAKNRLTETTQRLAEARAAQSEAKSSVKELKAITVQLAAYRQQLPLSSESSELLFYLNQTAASSGVVLERFESLGLKHPKDKGPAASGKKNTDVKTEGSIKVISYKVRVMGNYQQVHKFLKETEVLKRLIHNQSVTINEIKDLKTLECIVEFDTFIKQQGVPSFNTVSDIPPVKTGRKTLFMY